METFNHTPVLLSECIEGLNVRPDGIYVDCTLGGGGHSGEILKRLGSGKLIVIDKDADAIEFASERLKAYKDKVTFVHDDFKNIKNILDGLNISGIDGVLADLGVSSYQIDNAERGFSYMQDAPLDMRMDRSNDFSAYDVVNSYDEKKLADVIFAYGDERFAKNIAKNIVKERAKSPVSTTGQLAKIIEYSVPASNRWKFGNPAKRTFQAIRIEVNGELKNLDTAIRTSVDYLNPKGRMCVITFHSEEDRIVKQTMKDLATGCICDKSLPVCVCGRREVVKFVRNKAILPSDEEQTNNPRSKSAKLRIIEKL
ncbi:MAG: 16S rRNA (cytosine(1402)-N(4))-methyltransferase RsmH [Eubacteriales bacterium]|nr:16S rRNA (cytosine(1402)-N(4))-methyltransferase RsmH [Eubacteriales bacterium]